MSDRWQPNRFSDPNPSGHSGSMVGLWLAPDAAATLAVPGFEPADALHVTLLFMEDEAAELSEVQIAHLLACCDDIAAFWAPLSGDVSGLGRFYAPGHDADAKDVIFAIPDVPELSRLRERLAEDIGWEGLKVSDEHGFAPHITLAYVAPGAASPVDAVATIPLRFDSLTVCVGDRQVTIPLRGYPYDGICCADATVLGGGGHFFNEARFMSPPEWLPLLPAPGERIHPTYGKIDLTEDRIAAYVASVNNGVFQASIPIDISHDYDDLDLNGALGWFGQARVNPDGSADVKVDLWTDRGIKEVEADHFRYVSPVLTDVFTDATGTKHTNVVTGLALVVSPFFKELAIGKPGIEIDRALVASDRSIATPTLSLVRPQGEPMRFVASERVPARTPEVLKMADPTMITDPNLVAADPVAPASPQLPTFDQWVGLQPPGTDVSATAYATWLVSYCKKMDAAGTPVKEPLAAIAPAVQRQGQEFAQLLKRTEATEAELAKIKAANQEKAFTDEVRGRSDANNIQWFGDLENHVTVLKELSEGSRQRYIDEQRANAKRIQAALGREIGSDGGGRGESEGSAMAEINAKAKTYRDAHPDATQSQAIAIVTEADPKLYARYREEKDNR